jgi:hypothetical protein
MEPHPLKLYPVRQLANDELMLRQLYYAALFLIDEFFGRA